MNILLWDSYFAFLPELKWNQNRLFGSVSQYMLDENSVALLGTVRLFWYKMPVMNLWLILTNEDYKCVYVI